jgi:hypothetical protein
MPASKLEKKENYEVKHIIAEMKVIAKGKQIRIGKRT